MNLDAAIDDLIDELSDDYDVSGGTEVSSFAQLEFRCRASLESDVGRRHAVNAQVLACLAATELIGLVYGADDWGQALSDLAAFRRGLVDARLSQSAWAFGRGAPPCNLPRTSELTDHLRETERIAEQEFTDQFNHALRKFDADEDPETEDHDMATATARRKTAGAARESQAVEAWYSGAGELQWRCPQCRTEHHEAQRACGCEFVRPPLARLHELAKAGDADNLPETQAEAQAKAAAAEGPPPLETVQLVLSPATRLKVAIDLQPNDTPEGGWLDRIHWSSQLTSQIRESTELLGEHVVGQQTTRDATLECAFMRIRERIEGIGDEFLSEAGRKARPIALQELERERRRVLRLDKPDSLAAAQSLRRKPPKEGAAPVSTGETSSIPPSAQIPAGGVCERDVPVNLIDVRPGNPRQEFDAQALQVLADSIAASGLLQRVLLREAADGRYELWAGERRLRAVRDLLHRTAIAASVYPAGTPDADLVRARGMENLARENLNPVEEAAAYQQMLDAGSYRTQRELAAALGRSQGEVANRLGVLKLPVDWQQRVMSREMSPAHARAIIPWVHRPAVLQAVADELAIRCLGGGDPFGTQQQFRNLVARLVECVSRPLSGHWWRGTGSTNGDVVLTKAQRDDPRLDVEPVPTGAKGKTERRAFNTELWDCWQAEGLARLKSKRSKAEERDAAATGDTSPAEKRERAKQQAEQLRTKVARYKRAWLQARAAARVPQFSDALVLKLLLYCTTTDDGQRRRSIEAEVKDRGGFARQAKRPEFYTSIDVWGTLSSLPTQETPAAVRSLLAVWLQQDCESSRSGLHRDDVVAIAEECGVELEQEWRVDEAFLTLFTKDQLATLAREWKQESTLRAAGDKRSQQIAALLDVDQRKQFPVPSILKKAK